MSNFIQSTKRPTSTNWSSPWLREGCALRWLSTLGQHIIHMFHVYLHPEIISERRSSQQGLSLLWEMGQCKKTREASFIRRSTTDALKAFALVLPLFQRPVCPCATVRLEYTYRSASSLTPAPRRKLTPEGTRSCPSRSSWCHSSWSSLQPHACSKRSRTRASLPSNPTGPPHWVTWWKQQRENSV